ncbi:hypothetical protein GQ53DRAFT_767539 [Thozetella sp. PMI_491]|nr:hypothetical protein GQ53DRAFT_767539 [Thozetella sp. PMI_491]
MADSVNSTPKRKRGQLLDDAHPGLDTASFSFDLHAPLEDGSASPRSRVAHRFRGLAIESGGGVGGRTSPSPQPTSAADHLGDGAGDGARKRVKFPDFAMGGTDVSQPPPSPPQPIIAACAGSSLEQPKVSSAEQAAVASADPPGPPAPTAPTAPMAPALPATTSVRFAPDPIASDAPEAEESSAGPTVEASSPQDEAAGGKSRSRKRAGTPPLTLKTNPAAADLDSEEPIITDPVRAALTWHEDEITVYDPDDSEDDGTGINGIGFKPTPAIAYARNVKRMQQMAEYRKREEREARARRSRRRRGSPAASQVDLKAKAERRRVRFMESAAEVVGTV